MDDSPSPPSKGWFGPGQKRVLTWAATAAAMAGLALFVFGLFMLLRAFVTTFSNVLWPLAVAAILALLLRPVVGVAERRLHLSRYKAIALLYALVLIVATGAVSILAPLLVDQILSLIDEAPQLIETIRTTASQHYPRLVELLDQFQTSDIASSLEGGLASLLEATGIASLRAMQDAGGALAGFLGLLAGLAIVPVYLAFFLASDRDVGDDLDSELSFIKERWRPDLIFLLREFAGSLVAFFRGQIVIGLILGIFLATGFSIAGVKFGILLGLTLGILNIIPYLGTIVGLLITLPVAFFQDGGGILMVGIVLAIFAASQMLEGYVLTPKIMGKQTGLHPLIIIIAIFFWGTALNGLLGMVLAVPLTAFFVVAWRLVKRKYLEPQAHQAQATMSAEN